MALITSIGPVTAADIAEAIGPESTEAPGAVPQPVVAEATAAPAEAQLVEDRWALVFDGGVSLAIWEYGIARELLDLIRAADEIDAGDTPLGLPDTARLGIYRDAVRATGHTLQTDIIAGTSAGGINGVCLSKVLATGGSLDPLETLWMQRASVGQLLTILHPRSWSARSTGRSLFSGWRMSTWLIDAMGRIGERPRGSAYATHDVDLFVTATDLVGYDQTIPRDGVATGDVGKQNRMVFRFSSAEHHFDDDPQLVHALAFAARSTSSFPGAFAPSSLQTFPAVAGIDPTLPGARGVFGEYPSHLPRGAFPAVRLADGGLLDNSPFDLVIEAIATRSAQRAVDRRIVHVNPAPARGETPLAAGAARYGFFATVRKALGVQTSQSILADLLRVQDLNSEIARITSITADLQTQVDAVRSEPGAPAVSPQHTWRAILDDGRALTRYLGNSPAAAVNIRAYERLKIGAIADMMASDVQQLLGGGDDAPLPATVSAMFSAWATDWFWDAGAPGSDDTERRDFLRATDLPYQERRLRFLIAKVNELFPEGVADPADPGADAERGADRATYTASDVATVKGRLWDILNGIVKLRKCAVIRARDAARAALPSEAQGTREYVQEHRAGLTGLMEQLRHEYAAFDLAAELDRAFQDPGRDSALAPVLDRVGDALRSYPLWDAAVFPTIALTRLPQLSPISITRFSRLDLGDRGLTFDVKGLRLGHFGAFFSRAWRENDYIVGRLHGVLLVLQQFGVTDPRSSSTAILSLVDELRNDPLLRKPATARLLATIENWAKTPAPPDTAAVAASTAHAPGVDV